MSKYKTVSAAVAVAAALGTIGVALKDDVMTAYGDIKEAVRKFKIKIEIKGLEMQAKANRIAAVKMADAEKAAAKAYERNISEAAAKALKIVELRKSLEA